MTLGHDILQMFLYRRSWCQGRLRRGSAAARLLRFRVRIPPEAWKFVCCECCVLSDRGFCVGLISPAEESYRVWFVQCVWSRNPFSGSHDPESCRKATGKNVLSSPLNITHRCTLTDLGSKAGLQCERPVSDRMIRGAVKAVNNWLTIASCKSSKLKI